MSRASEGRRLFGADAFATAGFPRAGIIATHRRIPLPRFATFLRGLAATALLVAVGGCELFKHNEEATAIINQRVIGKPVGEFFDRYGRAKSRTEIGDSTAMYNWISDVGMTRPGPEGQDERVCKLRLTVDRAGRISAVDILYDAQGMKSTTRCGEIFAAP